VSDHRVHQEQIHQVAKPFIQFAWTRREGHAVELLGDVQAKRQARQLGRSGDPKDVG
jgi:hypothetical protein